MLALIPLLRSNFFGPMATALMGGITVATVLTLVYLPGAVCPVVPRPARRSPTGGSSMKTRSLTLAVGHLDAIRLRRFRPRPEAAENAFARALLGRGQPAQLPVADGVAQKIDAGRKAGTAVVEGLPVG